MKIVVFSGTTEAVCSPCQLAAQGAEVLVSVATPLGAEEQGRLQGVTVHCGRLTPEEMTTLLQGPPSAWTPPSLCGGRHQNIRSACKTACIEYHRLLRAESRSRRGVWSFRRPHTRQSFLQTPAAISCWPPGPRSSRPFPASSCPPVPPCAAHPGGIAACEAAHIPHKNIIAMQGPFSYALNRALLEQFHIRFLITKDGGAAGGFARRHRPRRTPAHSSSSSAAPQSRAKRRSRS